MNDKYDLSLREKFLKGVIHEFLEFCYGNPEVDLDPTCFYGNESKVIRDFFEDRQKKYEE